jgi:hypothetical protein
MQPVKINLPITGTAEELVNKARMAIEKQSGRFTGDDNQGSFSLQVMGSSIAGEYFVDGQELIISITEKPFFVPASVIEKFLLSQVS